MNKKKGLALYELITQKPSSIRLRSTEKKHDLNADEDNLEHNVLTPGRSIRFSVGTVGVLVAVSIAMVVISYTMGFRRGSAIAREDYANRLFTELPDAPQTKVINTTDPITVPEVLLPTPQDAASSVAWGAIDQDPRVQGNYYFTLIETTASGAMKLATFCRERGLETYVISGNNTPSHRVIALPGFEDRKNTVAVAIRSEILAIGRQWAETSAGRGKDLHDTYPSLY